MAQYPFKAEPVKEFSEIPAGSYICEIVKTDVMATKEGNGRYIFLEFRIKEGEFKGRKVFQRLNVLNRSQQAMDIGKRYLSQLCNAVGIESFNDTDEILNYEVIVKLGPENRLYGFSKLHNDNISEEGPPIIDEPPFIDDKIPF